MSTNRRPETLVLVALSLWAAWAGCKSEPAKDTSTGSAAPTAGDKAKDANRAPKAEPTADASQPPQAPEVQRVAPTAWCFAHGFAPPALWKCAATQKDCKRARIVEKRDEHEDYRVLTECDKADSLHCFRAEIGRTVCAPSATACAASRTEWTRSATATPCEVATPEDLRDTVR